jgi:hypothetical protein
MAQRPNSELPQPGTYPILFNDQHVNAEPQGFKRGRVHQRGFAGMGLHL